MKAREGLLESGSAAAGEISLSDRVHERITYQERKRLTNIRSVAERAALQLEDRDVPDTDPDHDWAARFFNDVQDVSSEEMQILWAKVLAGEVERPGSTSIRALACLREVDRDTAKLLARFCSACMFAFVGTSPGRDMVLARVVSLGGKAASNSLQLFGFGFAELNRQHEHGLIISDYDSWQSIDVNNALQVPGNLAIEVRFQAQQWLMEMASDPRSKLEFRFEGPALGLAGRELSAVVACEPTPEYAKELRAFLQRKDIRLQPLLPASK